MIKSRRIKRGKACTTNGEREMHIEYWWEIQKERDH
jgi:hypothetical protein